MTSRTVSGSSWNSWKVVRSQTWCLRGRATSRKTSSDGASIRWPWACSQCTRTTSCTEISSLTTSWCVRMESSSWQTWASVSSCLSRSNTGIVGRAPRRGFRQRSPVALPTLKKWTCGPSAALLTSCWPPTHPSTLTSTRVWMHFSTLSLTCLCRLSRASGPPRWPTSSPRRCLRTRASAGASTSSSATPCFKTLRLAGKAGSTTLRAAEHHIRRPSSQKIMASILCLSHLT
mmetsp:Transcript_28815/g.38440  ORF Transcript_28815/g.38440 Transcript_28815/m.38440 type:complete len:232 (+) Transcript_28815:1047-1742(+)